MSEMQSITPQQIREFGKEFRQLIHKMPFQAPEDLILLGRTIGILSGMCTGLNPDFNVWEGLTPYAQKLIVEDAAANRKALFEQLGTFIRNLLTYPKRIESLLAVMERGELAVRDPQLSHRVEHLERTINRVIGSIIFFAFFISGIQVYLSGQIVFGGVLALFAIVALAWTILSTHR